MGTDLLHSLRLKATKGNWGKANRQENFFLYSYSSFTSKLEQLAANDDRTWQ
jgi:hypothetical protein